MSSTMDSGHYASERLEQQETKCDKSPTAKHDFVQHGSWPSVWEKCKHCGLTLYSK